MGSDSEHGWRYTWEAQSHIPTLRLMLFPNDKTLNPSLQCHDLTVELHSSHSFLTLASSSVSLRVPLPAVLVDGDSPVTFRPLSDHIEVKLLLLLPVDHPILSTLHPSPTPPPDPLESESDVKKLSSAGEVDFYCRTCAFKLTKTPLRNFVEMPSVNWREVADNWFGACCCSFGGISEKMVMRYVSSYMCAPGKCLLSSSSVTLCKDDLVECNFPEGYGERECSSIAENPGYDGVGEGSRNCELNGERTSTCSDDGGVGKGCGEQEFSSIAENPGDDGVGKGMKNCELNDERTSTCSGDGGVTLAVDNNSRFVRPEDEKLSVNLRCEVAKSKPDCGDFSDSRPDSNDTEDVIQTPSCCAHLTSILGNGDSEHHLCGTAGKEGVPAETMEILGNQKSFLNGFLEDVFMARLSNLSKDIDWREFTCPQCMSLLGAYPCCEGHTPVDGGVRLFKCYISTCVPVGGSGDMFSKYTMCKMFANQLMECAHDESSFRFVIRDLTTKFPALQIILLNPDTWSCSGNCSSTEDKDPVPKLKLQPIIKVLFSDCHKATKSQLRMIEEWATKSSAENIFMLPRQTQELVGLFISAKDLYPPSCASLQGLILSSVQR
ncbi:Ubiquitin-conjugating enzyme E2-binding protein [Spatholobus suberectus]|nr:Ubiquitin-conjugating enzyme E2-binding protein [Spatholobus suberectus]